MDLAHLDELILAGAEAGKITVKGIENSLLVKARSAQDAENPSKQIKALTALTHELEALSGKKVDEKFAALLLEEIRFIQASISN